MSRFLRLGAFLSILFFATNVFASGYTCPSYKRYTSCNPDYYLNGTQAGNSCDLCPSGCTCSGGTAQPDCSIRITYDLNGGSGTTPSATQCTSGVSCSLQSGATTSFYRAGHVFKGWATSPTATSGSTSITVTASRTVYAIWSKCGTGTYKTSSAQASATCSTCPTGYQAGNGATARSGCQASCAAGYAVLNAQGSCTSIQNATYTGKYITAHMVNYGETSTINTCPTNYQAGNGTTAKDECKITCRAGYAVLTSEGACESIMDDSAYAGLYTDEHTVKYGAKTEILVCPDGYDARLTGSETKSGCQAICNAGYAVLSAEETCTTIQNSTYKGKFTTYHTVNYGATSPISTCPTNYQAGNGTTAQANCKASCAAGYAVLTARGACTTIQNSTYKGKYITAHTVKYGATSSISTCPTNYQAGNGTTTQANCKASCSAGYAVLTSEGACVSIDSSAYKGLYTDDHYVKYGEKTELLPCSDDYQDGNGAATKAGCQATCPAGYAVINPELGCVNIMNDEYTGQYTDEHNVSYGDISVIQMCPDGYGDGKGTNTIEGCQASCAAGSAVLTAGGACDSMMDDEHVGMYTDDHIVSYGDTSVIETCPDGYHDGEGAETIEGCLASCAAGYAVLTAGGACTSIQNATYKGKYITSHAVNYGATSTISTCPTNYQAGNGATAQANCTTSCSAGYAVLTAREACTTIQNSTYKGKYITAHTVKYGATSSISTCPTNYRAGNGTTAQANCSLVTTAGKYVATAGAGETACVSPYYCPGGTTIKYGTGTTVGGNTACTSLGSFYTKSAGGAIGASGCYGTTTAGKYIKTQNSSTQETCPAGSYCPATNVYYGKYDTTGGRSNCTGATYSESGAASCTNCPSGYTANTTSNKTSASQCQISCAAGTQVATANAQCTTPSGNWYTTASQLVNYGSTSSVNACKVATNLFNPSDYDSLWGYISSSSTTVTAYEQNAIVWVPVEPNTTYIVSGMRGANTMTMANSASVPVVGGKYSNFVDPGSVGKGVLYTTSSDAKYLILMGLRLADGSTTSTRQSILDKNVANLQIFKASDGYGIIGNATTDHDAAKDCTITCGPGQYVATEGSACVNVGAGYYATGGTVGYGGTSNRTQCTTTSGWTTTTGTDTSSSYSACYQTQTPSGCASGIIKRVASSISGTTITYGSASVSTDLSAKANYYVSGTSCLVCTGLGSFYTTSAGGAIGASGCYGTTTAGKYIKTQNSSTQETCPAGSYCPATNVYYGKYDTTGGRAACPSGYGASAEGSDAAADCYMSVAAKKYVKTANDSTATACGTGTYKAAHTVYYGGTSTCSSCPSGYDDGAAGATEGECVISVAGGKYVGTAKSATLSTCAGGTYKAQHTVVYGSTSSCGTCSAGYYCPEGASAAKACSALASGFYPNSAAGSDAATDCKTNSISGKYVASVNATGATNCAAGTYKGAHQVNYGSTSSCGTCPANSYCPAGSSAAKACSALASGFYPNSAAGSDAATDCKTNVLSGKYVASANATGATSCAAGKFKGAHQVNYGSTSLCDACALGSYSAAGASACTACQNGKTTSGTGKSSCDATCGNNNSYDSTWATATWSDNAVANLCQIATCAGGSRYTSAKGEAAGTLPSGYTQLAYLESTGTQYIDTGVIADLSTSAKVGFALTDITGTPAVFGARASKTSRAFNVWARAGSGYNIGANLSSTGATYSEIAPSVNTEYTVLLSSTHLVVNDDVKKISGAASFTTPGNMWLFNINGGGTSTTGSSNRLMVGRVYYFQVHKDSNLVLNLIPAVRDSDGVLGMYDTVNNKFLVNAGSGKFVAGPIILKSMNTCTQCSAGTYSAGGTATSCETCPSGYGASAAGSDVASDCYMSVAAKKYVKTANDSTATACGTGTYKAAHTVYYGGTSTCSSCPSGYDDGAAGATEGECVISVAGGKYVGTAKSATLSTCAGGTYKAQHTVVYGSTSSCGTCSAGYYCPEGAGSQTECGGNTKYSGSGAAACSDVSSGYYSTGGTATTRTGQTKCEAGNYCSGGVKTACSAGTYQPDTGKTSCLSADKGYYVSGTAKTAQTACAGATYQNETGKTSCKSCPAGYTANTASAKIAASQCQISCAAGTQVATANAQCTTPSGNWYTTASQLVNYGSTSSVNACKVATNLFNPSDYDSLWAYISSSSTTVTAYEQNAIVWVPVEPNTTYIVSGMRGANTMTMANSASVPVIGGKYSNYVDPGSVGKGVLYTTSSDAKYLILMGLRLADGSTTSTRQSILNKNVANLQIFKASDGYGIIGNATTDHDAAKDCTITCGPGQYVANAGSACVNVGAGYYATGGTVAYGSTSNRTQCTSPLTTIGYGTGANEAEDCGRKLHAGANVIYLRSAARTSPSLRVKVGDTTFYGALSTSLSSPLKVKNGSTTYSVVNDWQ